MLEGNLVELANKVINQKAETKDTIQDLTERSSLFYSLK